MAIICTQIYELPLFLKNIHITIVVFISLFVLSNSALAQSKTLDVVNDNKKLVAELAKNKPIDTVALRTDSLRLPADSLKKERIEAPIDYKAADSIFVSFTSNKMRMYNKSEIRYQEQQITAYNIEGDMKNNVVNATYGLDTTKVKIGYPVVKDKDREMEGEKISYNMKTKKAVVRDIITQEGEGYVQSAVAKKVSDNTFYMRDGRYTTCDHHDDPHYYINLKKFKMIKEDKVVTGPAYLVIEGVKLPLIVPFGLFPLKKRFSSGIIMPSFGEEKRRGFFFRDFGYYWAASKYFDMRFSSSLYTNGSWETNIASNYVKRYKYNGRFKFTYGVNKFGDEGLDDYERTKDFSIRWTHNQDPKAHPYRSFRASVDISSSQNDYRNARSINNIVQNTKQSSISYSRRWPDSPFNLNVALQHSQNRQDTTISLTLPNVSFTMQTQYPFRPKTRAGQMKWYDKISVGYSANLTNKIKTHEDKILKSKLSRDWRNGFQHNIPIGASYKLARDLTFSANLNYTGVAYLNSVRKSYDPIKDRVITDTINGFKYAHNFTSSTSLAFTPKFFGMYDFKKGGKIKAIRHVISPSLSFSYTPDWGFDDDKYFKTYSRNYTDDEVRYNVLSEGTFGFPRKAMKAGMVNFSLDNNIEMKIRDDKDSTSNDEFKKIKLLESFRISTSYNMFADSMKFSNIQLSGRTSLLNRKVIINMGGTIDPYALNSQGARINKFAGGLGRLVTAHFTLGTSIDGNTFGGNDKDKNNSNNSQGNRQGGINNGISGGDNVFGDRGDVESFNDINEYVDFKIPWSFNIDYKFTYINSGRDKARILQNLRLRGDVNLTEKWKVSVNTGYDFTKKEVTMTSFNIFRDLHCWEMSFSAIPFGQRQSYEFRIAVKSSLLQDLKYEKRDSWYDNF